ncbi:MAG: hypothetical protein REH83_04330 [Rickettsiella sp.]|nr:hypothetical protein [Rickettsiella sp.]
MTDNKNNLNFDVNLDELFSQLSEILVNPAFSKSALSFLLLLWGYFEITVLDAFEEGGEGTTTRSTVATAPNIIQIENAYDIFDQGIVLKTSPGKYYGNYSTGRLLTTVKAMVNLLIKRGAKQVSFSGLPAAERTAWLECKKHNINTQFEPDKKSQLLQARINELDRFREVVYSLSAKNI